MLPILALLLATQAPNDTAAIRDAVRKAKPQADTVRAIEVRGDTAWATVAARPMPERYRLERRKGEWVVVSSQVWRTAHGPKQ